MLCTYILDVKLLEPTQQWNTTKLNGWKPSGEREPGRKGLSRLKYCLFRLRVGNQKGYLRVGLEKQKWFYLCTI